MKKKYRTFLGTVATLLLCCVMLTCNIFAANPAKIVESNGVVVSFGGTQSHSNAAVPAGFDEHVFVDGTFTGRFNRSFTCYPLNGKYLNIEIVNTGTNYIRFTCFVDIGLDPVETTFTTTLAPGEDYPVRANSTNGNGLSCSFSINVEPSVAGSDIEYTLTAKQTK